MSRILYKCKCETLLGQWENSTNRRSWLLQVNSGQLTCYLSADGTTSGQKRIDSASGAISTNRWYHLAYARSGDTMRLFIDGEQVGSVDVTGFTNYANTDDGFQVGSQTAAGSNLMSGFISNARIIKGTGIYTSRFTPPTRELTNVTNTKLLCCQSNTSATELIAPSVTGYTGTGAITLSSASLDAGAVANIVDGNTSTSADIRGAGSFVQMVFPQQQNGTLQVNVANGNDVSDDNIRVFIDGVEGTAFDVSSQSWYTIHTGNFTTVKLEHQGSTTGYIYGFRIGTGGDTIINGGITANGDAAATTFNPFITDIHAVRGQETGYPTWNPLRVSGQTLSNGNMTTTGNSGNVLGSMFTPTSGKFYWEVTAGSDYTMTGIQRENNYDMSYPGNSTGQIAMYLNTGVGSGQLYEGGSITSSWGGGVTGDVIGVALDMDNNKVYFYNNGRGLGTGGITGTPEAVDVPTGGGYTEIVGLVVVDTMVHLQLTSDKNPSSSHHLMVINH